MYNNIPLRGAFQVKKNIKKKLDKHRNKITKRLKNRNQTEQSGPVLNCPNINYDIDGRHSGISCGGIGIFHQLIQRIGLVDKINDKLKLLKRHMPYHESDHILNIAYNILTGGSCLEDIELRRNDAAYLDALGAKTIPDPTTAGDYLRRYAGNDVVQLMDILNEVRKDIWKKQPRNFKKRPSSMLMSS
jgi:hypothetical protein